MDVKIYTPNPPAALLAALASAPLRYTTPVCLYHCIWLGMESALDGSYQSYCGVFGDGDNATYEWFVWRKGVLETSDNGYGMTEVALRDVLNKVI